MLLALTRAVPRSIDRCELTHLERTPIDYARAVDEHNRYEAALRALGCRVERLPDAPDLPDSVFVEDTAVVFDEFAVIARPGAASRRGEVAAAAAALARYRRLAFIQSPGTLDGGDVLVVPGKVFVGDTPRTNGDGARQLASMVAPLGYEVVRVPVTKCLHLKSAVSSLPPQGGSYENRPAGNRPVASTSVASTSVASTSVASASVASASVASASVASASVASASVASAPVASAPVASAFRRKLLINRDWVDAAPFAAFHLIDVDPSEPPAANVLAIGDRVLCACEFPRTRARIEDGGFVTVSVPAGELAKAEGGLTCGSLVLQTFDTRPESSPT